MSEPLTLASLFQLDPDRLSGQAVAALRSAEGMKDLPGLLGFHDDAGVWAGATGCLARALHRALDLPVEQVLTRGWNTVRQLRQYVDPQRYPPDEPIEHVLHQHTIRSTHHPTVELLIDGVPIGQVTFDVVLEASIETATLVILGGRILEIRAGTCRFSGELKYHDVVLAQLSSAEHTLPGSIRIPGGLPIALRTAEPAGA